MLKGDHLWCPGGPFVLKKLVWADSFWADRLYRDKSSAFLGAHLSFTTREGGPLLVSRIFPNTLGKSESRALLWDLLE